MNSKPRLWIPRPLMALVGMLLVIGVALAAWTYEYARSRIDAIEYVTSTGGGIHFEPAPAYLPEWLPIPRWMQTAEAVSIGAQSPCDLQRVIALHETETLYLTGRLTFDALQPVQKLRKLKRVALSMTAGPDVGRALRECRRLESISFAHSSIRDDDLSQMSELPLKELKVIYGDITDAGLKSLDGSSLRKLVLVQTSVTDGGLKHLRRMHSLSVLRLYGVQVTDEGLRELAGLPLTHLALMQTDITDDGLGHLTTLPLQALDLRDTAVTPEGLRVLKGMKSLATIYVSSSYRKFKTADVQELQNEKLPVVLDPELPPDDPLF